MLRRGRAARSCGCCAWLDASLPLHTSEAVGERLMPSIECPSCNGSGYVQEDGGERPICARCDGTGVVFVDEGVGDVLSDDQG